MDGETCVVLTGKTDQLQQHMNTVDPVVFIREEEKSNSTPFIGAQFTRMEESRVKSTVYGKNLPTP